jgi:hypothetical protein
MINPIDQAIETDIDAAIEARRDAENVAVISAEDAEEEVVPYCCVECEGQETLFAILRSVR